MVDIGTFEEINVVDSVMAILQIFMVSVLSHNRLFGSFEPGFASG